MRSERNGRRRGRIGLAATVVGFAVLLAAFAHGVALGQPRRPVYVGARVCAECHEGEGMGHQFSRWLLTPHSRAYAALATPEAWEIARFSGVPVDPREAMACLGCHATAADADEWERDPTFRIDDGVQCERCHGPGSEYIDESVMRNREAAELAGLRFLSERECALCHYVKGSHVAVHHRPKLALDEARARIAHPLPEQPSSGTIPDPGMVVRVSGQGPRFVGVEVCGRCHAGRDMGYQLSRWRLGPHARAYAVLATAEAAEMARQSGVEGSPQRSPACLTCHTTGGTAAAGWDDTFSLSDGVGCESCHGAGSGHVAEAAEGDPRANRGAGPPDGAAASCRPCHEDAHARPFDLDKALARIAHPARPPEPVRGPVYKTPVNLALRPDGRELWIACEASGTVAVVDVGEREKIAEIAVGGQPHDVTFSPEGSTAYVSTRLDDSVAVVDTATHEVRRIVPVADEPHGVLTDRSGRRLFVLNTASGDISILDTGSFREIRRLAASRNPWSLALAPDGRRMLVTNNLTRFVPFRSPLRSEVTVIDVEHARVDNRIVVPDTNLLQGVSWHPSGDFAFITLNRTKNLIPMTRILQGWTITNGLGLIWSDGRVDQVLLDEPNLYFPDPADVAFSPDGGLALVTSSGSDRVAVVDVARLLAILGAATDEERERVLPNHLGTSVEFVTAHLPTGASPRGVIVSPDGTWAYVANALDDSVTVIDMRRLESAATIDLGGPKEITRIRRGERLFHSADIAFQRQFSCHSCHPDGHVDGITYDIEPDGIGLNPVDNRTLRGILDTDPFKWTGLNRTLSRQCGPRLAVFFTRVEPFDPDELAALESYIRTIPRPPNRHRPLGAPLTSAQRRGKEVFERTTTNDGRAIPPEGRCVTCHFPPLFTDRSIRDVGTKMELDTHEEFDVPHLTNIYSSAPYLHNGIASTLEEIWTRYNPDDRHGVTNDLTKDQLNDLIEYLKTL